MQFFTLPSFRSAATLGLFAFASCLVLSNGRAGDSAEWGALAAFRALPERFRNGVVLLSADNASPQPANWYFLARNANARNALFSITVSRGQVIDERPSLDMRTMFHNPSRINFDRVRVDSGDVWSKADAFAKRKGRILGSLSLNLTQSGKNAAPVWKAWCYDPSARYFGQLHILATTGEVISETFDGR
jgi:hypothetical protein